MLNFFKSFISKPQTVSQNTSVKNIINKVYDDRYNKDGTHKQQIDIYSFKAFADVSLPKPQQDKKVILLTCTNKSDGVGDFEHFKKYYQRVKRIVGDTYEIKTVLSVYNHTGQDDEAKQANAIQHRVRQSYREFCKREGLEPLLKEEIEDAKLTALVEKSAAIFNISYGNFIHDYVKNTKQFIVQCHELGRSNSAQLPNAFEEASMGLEPEEKSFDQSIKIVYGIEIDPYEYEVKSAAKELIECSSEQGKALVEHLLHGEVTQEKAEQYLKTHHCIPGYPQGRYAGLNFVLTGIMKNIQDNKLNANCDFFLPKNCLVQKELAYYLKSLGIDAAIEIVTPTGTVSIEAPVDSNENAYKVRIFSGFYVDDKEYQHLFRMRTDLGLGSGDNTIAQILSSQELPFIQVKQGFIESFVYQLKSTIELIAKESNESEKFKKLVRYFQLQCDFNQTFSLSERDNMYGLTGGKDKISPDKLQNKEALYIAYLKEVSNLAQDPDVKAAWQMVQSRLQKEYNYEKYFYGILVGALYLNNPNPKENVKGETPRTLSEIVKRPYLYYHQLRQYFTKNEIDFLTSPQAQQLMARGDEFYLEKLVKLAHVASIDYRQDYLKIFKTFYDKVKRLEKQTNKPYPKDKLIFLLFLHALGFYPDHIPEPNQPMLIDENILERLKNALDLLDKHQYMESEKLQVTEWALSSLKDFATTWWEFVTLIHRDVKKQTYDVIKALLDRSQIVAQIPDYALHYIVEVVQAREAAGQLDVNTANEIKYRIQNEMAIRQRNYIPDNDFYLFAFGAACEQKDATLAKYFNTRVNVDFSRFNVHFQKHPVELAMSPDDEIRKLIWKRIKEQKCFDQIFSVIIDNFKTDDGSYFSKEPYKEAIDVLADNHIQINLDRLIEIAEKANGNENNTTVLENRSTVLLEGIMARPTCISFLTADQLQSLVKVLEVRSQHGQITKAWFEKIKTKIDNLANMRIEQVTDIDKENRPPKRVKPVRFSELGEKKETEVKKEEVEIVSPSENSRMKPEQ